MAEEKDPKEFFKDFKQVLEDLRERATLLLISPNMLEEELVAVLSQIDAQEAGIGFFNKLGAKLFAVEAWELLNVVKTHIEYNFDAEIVTKKGITQYEVRKRP